MKDFFFQLKITAIFFSHDSTANICCVYSVEEPRRGASNEYSIYFCREIQKLLLGYPVLLEAFLPVSLHYSFECTL